MVEELMKAVKEFHQKHTFWLDLPLKPVNSNATAYLLHAGKLLRELSDTALKHNPVDPRAVRAHLILQEVGETLEELARCDEERTLDGLGDTMYVLAGIALCFNLPLGPALTEIHRSNMSKNCEPADILHPKGKDYSPPDLTTVLRNYRAQKP